MDIMLWLADSKCKKISSFGELTYFTEENAPTGAPEYCMDGCEHRDQCPFYAPRFYLEHPKAVEDGLVYAVTDLSLIHIYICSLSSILIFSLIFLQC